jgi:hypothetical protein
MAGVVSPVPVDPTTCPSRRTSPGQSPHHHMMQSRNPVQSSPASESFLHHLLPPSVRLPIRRRFFQALHQSVPFLRIVRTPHMGTSVSEKSTGEKIGPVSTRRCPNS